MLLVQLFLLFAVSAVGPGFVIVRRLRLSPPEKLVASVGLSFAFVYLGTFAIYLLHVDHRWHVALSLVCLLLTLYCGRDLLRLFQHHHVRRIALGWVIFVLWGLLLLAFVRNYAGGTWSVDWLEHYHRALFFLEHRPTDILLGGLYPLSARPPVMNLIATDFLAQVDPGYETYQVLALLLNSLVFLPCCLVAGNFFRRAGRHTPWLVLLLLAANPMVAQNLTYSWTRMFTAFYVVLAVHLYLRGWRRGTSAPTALAFVMLSVGFLVHFSAGPYIAFLGAHYVGYALWTRRKKLVEVAVTATACAVVLMPYFAWSIGVYGAKATFASNTTVSGEQATAAAGRPADVAANLGKTLAPTVLWRPAIMSIPELEQPSAAGRVRDYAFLVYQLGYPWAVGSAGMLLAIVLTARVVTRRTLATNDARASSRASVSDEGSRAPERLPPPEIPQAAKAPIGMTDAAPSLRPRVSGRCTRWFWALFVPITCVLGVAVNPGADRFGVAQICLQPLALLTLAFVAAGFTLLRKPLRWLLVAGLLLDFSLGIFLHFTLQNRDYFLVQTPAGYAIDSAGPTLSQASQANAAYKIAPLNMLIKDDDPILKQQGILWYFGDNFAGLLPALQAGLGAGFALLLWLGLRPYVLTRPVTAMPKRIAQGVDVLPPRRRGKRPRRR